MHTIATIFTHIAQSFYNNLIAEQRYRMILEGLQVTLLITFCAAVLGTLLGGLVCWARMNRRPWLRQAAIIYIDLMRGTPVLVFMMLMYYVFMAPLDASGITVAVVTFAMNMSAYAGEMFRSAIEGIDRGQTEAGLALGYTPQQTFLRIVLPQVVRQIMPVYLGEVISLLKGTSIVGYIAIVDMTRASDLIRSRTFDAFFPLILTAAIYFVVAWLIGVLLNGLVQKRRTRSITAAVALVVLGILGSVPGWVDKGHSTLHPSHSAGQVSAPPVFSRLEGKTVATVVGSIQDIALTRYAHNAEIMRFTSVSDILAALANGKVDVVCMENMTVTANKNVAAVVDTIDAGLPPTPVAACFRLNNTELQQDFNAYLAQIKSDGTYREMEQLWLENDDVFSVPVPKRTGTGKTLTIATFSGFPPFNYISSGVPSGLEIDLLTRWANSRNYRMEFLMMDFASQIPAVQTGKADMSIGSIAATEERRKQVLFSDGYYDGRIMFYTRKGEGGMLETKID